MQKYFPNWGQPMHALNGEQHPNEAGYYLAADVDAREAQSVAVIKAQRERIAELEQRLELWGTTATGERIRLDFGADGIACRDETIALLDGVREGLLKRVADLEAALLRHGGHKEECDFILDTLPCSCGFEALRLSLGKGASNGNT